jgi:hypothetical protein
LKTRFGVKIERSGNQCFGKPSDGMKSTYRASAGQIGVYSGLAILLFLALSAIQSQAQVTNLTASGTSLQITLGGSSAGLSDWTVDGVNQLDYQWFYYSIGGGTLSSIDTISAATAPTFVNAQPNPFLSETYANSALSLKTTFQLQGASASAGRAGLQTTISIQNLSGTNETFHLYQLSDFDLANTAGGQTVQFAGIGMPYQVTQFGSGGGPLVGTISAIGATIEEEAGLETGSNLGLGTGNAAPIFNDTSLSATGAVEYAYEIDINLSANQSLTISELQSVPEPSTLALVALALGGLVVFKARRLVFKKNI